jgi:hypothetical protein
MDDDAARAFDITRKQLGFMVARAPDQVKIEMVFPASRAKMAGLEVSDVVYSFNDNAIPTTQDFAVALDAVDLSLSFTMGLLRSGEELTLTFPSHLAHQEHLTGNLVAERNSQTPQRLQGNVILSVCQMAGSGKQSGVGYLRATPDGLEFVSEKSFRYLVPLLEIVDIRVATSKTSRVTITRVLLIGVFALAAQKKQQFTVLEVRTRYTTYGFVTTEPQAQVVEMVKPLVARLHQSRTSEIGFISPPSGRRRVDEESNVSALSSSQSFSQQIRELAELRVDGLITDEEFDIAKKKILGS